MDVIKNKDILYMAYYLPQFHIIPENKVDNVSYTDWDFIKKAPHSVTPIDYYNLADMKVLDRQDELANEYKIGVFIFYHYWLDNKMIMNLPVDLYNYKKRKTKFMFCWDNQSGFLGKQYYNSPEEHAYQLLRFFLSDNYFTEIDGSKPFLIYSTTNFEKSYLDLFLKFLENYNIKLKVGFHYQKYKNNWYVPEYCSFAAEFAPHMKDGCHSGSNESGYHIHENNFNDYWQSAMVSWDSRPRISSRRTGQNECDMTKPNGCVSVEEFRNQVRKIKNNISRNNRNKVITLFAWNEWSEGASLEESKEFGRQFLECL